MEDEALILDPPCSVTQKTAADGKRQEIIVLDSKRSNAINIGLTVLPPPRTIKIAILNFDEYALNKEGIEVRAALPCIICVCNVSHVCKALLFSV